MNIVTIERDRKQHAQQKSQYPDTTTNNSVRYIITNLLDTCLAIDHKPSVEAVVSFEESTALFGQLIHDFCHNFNLRPASIAGVVLILVLRHQGSEVPVPFVIPRFGISSEEDVSSLGGLDHCLRRNCQ